MAEVAERLRAVRHARRKFLRLWAVEQALVDPLLDRLAEDLASDATTDSCGTGLHPPPPSADKT